ncbi:MAG: hypothetical protein JRG90_13510 [Deltaproteobacteria bacterium]|nr:hypothetical protein [Deltaproteobacteria bacterium]
MRRNKFFLIGLLLGAIVLLGNGCPRGLSFQAFLELSESGVNKYIGEFDPVVSVDVGDGWVKHTYDPDGGNGPICVAGTPYSAFTKAGNPSNLLIMLQGGGACWQNFYFCNILAEDQEPPPPPAGIWDSSSPDNPFADYSIVYMPYCDGSVFSGDNDVVDASFPFGPVRFHRGLRNVTAGMDLARATFPHASRITIAGSSAGGVGAAAFTPFLARFLYGNNRHLTVFNDAGPVAVNLADVGSVAARAADWQFGQFYPASCTDCDPLGQATAVIQWRLDNDSTIREAFYETDADGTNRFFTSTPTQEMYRDLILTEHGALNDAHPDRYKRFIVSGDASHTALQSPLFYSQEVDGVPLNEWTEDFLVPTPFWVDLVEDFIPFP